MFFTRSFLSLPLFKERNRRLFRPTISLLPYFDTTEQECSSLRKICRECQGVEQGNENGKKVERRGPVLYMPPGSSIRAFLSSPIFTVARERVTTLHLGRFASITGVERLVVTYRRGRLAFWLLWSSSSSTCLGAP